MGCRELQLNNYFHFSGDNISSHKETEVNEEKNGNGFNHPCKFVFIRGSEEFQTIVTNPNVTNPNAHVTPESGVGGTDMLYSGEQFDLNLQMQYLRARYYDQNNGRFNRLDPFGGNNYDPQSLHKYGYAHSNPVMGIDPSGKFSIIEFFTNIALNMTWTSVATNAASGAAINGVISIIMKLSEKYWRGEDFFTLLNGIDVVESMFFGAVSGVAGGVMGAASSVIGKSKILLTVLKRLPYPILTTLLTKILLPGVLKGVTGTLIAWGKDVLIDGNPQWSVKRFSSTMISSIVVASIFESVGYKFKTKSEAHNKEMEFHRKLKDTYITYNDKTGIHELNKQAMAEASKNSLQKDEVLKQIYDALNGTFGTFVFDFAAEISNALIPQPTK